MNGDIPFRPWSNLVSGADGALYLQTVAEDGGDSGAANIIRITPDGMESTLFTFPGTLALPSGNLLQASNGNFYTLSGWPNTISGQYFNGAVLQVSAAGSGTALYTFPPSPANAPLPPTGPSDPYFATQSADGNLYVLGYDGATRCDAVFKVTLSGSESLVQDLPCNSTIYTYGLSLIQGSDGNLYGTTSQTPVDVMNFDPSATGAETLFRITPDGTYSVVYTFGTFALGDELIDTSTLGISVIQASDGNFYGTSSVEGANGFGTIFKVTPDGQGTVLYTFGQSSVMVNGSAVPADGGSPSGITQARDGNFYGTTLRGGMHNSGTIFRLTPDGQYTVLYSFSGADTEGSIPLGSLIQASDGRFYGMMDIGGKYNSGLVYSFAAP